MQPVITSISPTQWPVGVTTTVTILGSGLCYASPYMTMPADGGSVTFSDDFSIQTNVELQFTVTPDASDPTETATVSLWSDCNTDWGPCFTVPSINVQIVACPKPNITSITPSTWFAGKTYDNVKIMGTGFIMQEKATGTCPKTDVKVTTPDGSVVTVSNVDVESKTKITVSIKPDARTTTEQATVIVGTDPNSVTYSGQPPAQILGNEIHCDPSMNCTQDVISTTDGSTPPTQTVVAGQPIKLTTNPNLPKTIKPTKTVWTLTDGMNIREYHLGPAASNGSPSSASIKPTVLDTSGLTTYWLYPNSSVPVTYQYCADIPGVGNQCSLPANATFNVTGPKAQITPFQSANDTTFFTWGWWVSTPYTGCDTNPGKPTQMLVFGMYPPPGADCTVTESLYPGIYFEATNVDTSGVKAPNASFQWVQLITGGQTTGTRANGFAVSRAPVVTGLDNLYPYGKGTKASDAPSSQLVNAWASQTKMFSAQMYLMWNSNPGSAIPVPIGYETWNINGTAYNGTGTPPWFLSPSSITSQATTSYTASNAQQDSYGMPTWTKVSLNPKKSINESESGETDGEEENQQ